MKNILLVVLVTIVAMETSYGQTYKVIVNNTNPISSIDKSELSDYFMKKETKYLNGKRIVPVDQKGNSSVRKSFTSEVHNKSVTAVKSFWQQAVFQGKDTPPVEKSSDGAVIADVANNPGAIGYVSMGTETSGVKTISIK